MAKLYTVYTDAVSYKPEFRPAKKSLGGATAIYLRRVRADSRLEALNKCLPDLQKELPKIQGIYLSVFVGEKCNPSAFADRLSPIQIVVATGKIR